MPSKATVTSTIGPGVAISAKVFNNLQSLVLDFIGQTATIVADNQPPVVVSLSAVTTFTDSISGTNHTIVMS